MKFQRETLQFLLEDSFYSYLFFVVRCLDVITVTVGLKSVNVVPKLCFLEFRSLCI